MRAGVPWMAIGISMFILGLVLFYTIDYSENKNLEIIKNTGTFVGLTGIGVFVAGVIIFLINRNPQPIIDDFESE